MRNSWKADDSHFLHLKNFLASQNLSEEETTNVVQGWRKGLAATSSDAGIQKLVT
jgi:hypothetical protein